MDIDREFAAANRRIQNRINRSTNEALARINKPTPTELRDGTRKPVVFVAAEAFGYAMAACADEISKAVEAVVRGFRSFENLANGGGD